MYFIVYSSFSSFMLTISVKNIKYRSTDFRNFFLAVIPPNSHIGCLLSILGVSLIVQLVKNLPAMWETQVRSLGLGRSPGEGKGYPLQYSGLENSMKSQTRLSDFHFLLSILSLCHKFIFYLKIFIIIIFNKLWLKKFFLAKLHSIWDFISLTRDRTHAPCIGRVES